MNSGGPYAPGKALAIDTTVRMEDRFIGSQKARIFLLGFRWIALLLGLFITELNAPRATMPNQLPAAIASFPMAITIALLSYHLFATVMAYKTNERNIFAYTLILFDSLAGGALCYFYGLPYFMLGFLLPVLETAYYFGFTISLFIMTVIGGFFVILEMTEWASLKKAGNVVSISEFYNMIKIYVSMAVLLTWIFVASMGEEETIFHLQKKYLTEKNLLFEELQSTKREIGEVFNELEKRQAYIQELEGELSTAKAEVEELYKRLHEARLQTQATQKLSEQKEMQLAQTLKRETDELKKKLERLTSLLDAFQMVSRSLNLNDSLLVVTDIIGKLLPSQSCILFLMDTVEGNKELFAEVAASPYAEYFRNFSLKLGEGAPGWVGLHREPLKIDNGTVQLDSLEISTLLTYEKSALLVPLVCAEELLGILYLGRQNANAFTNENMDMLQELTRLISVSLRNSMNYQKVITSGIYDEVTSLYNFLYFNERLSEEIKRAKRYSYSICLILVDVDNFSKYNESFGTEMGDKVLKEVSEILKEHIRETDVVSRLENDDFAIILVQSEKNSAILIGERIRMAMEMRSFGSRQRGRVSVSLGIANFPQDSQSREELIARADAALAESKSKGGNHTCFAQ